MEPVVKTISKAREQAHIDQAVAALRLISRTFNGVSDTSTSPIKAPLVLSGPALATKVEDNFRKTLASLMTSYRGKSLKGETEAAILVVDAFFAINEGLLQKGRSIFRNWETNIPQHVKLSGIRDEMERFYTELLTKFNGRRKDPIAFAAWIEKRLNGEIHPFTDGCGRVARVLACFALIEANLPYPKFPSRDEFFLQIQKPFDAWLEFYRLGIKSAQTA